MGSAGIPAIPALEAFKASAESTPSAEAKFDVAVGQIDAGNTWEHSLRSLSPLGTASTSSLEPEMSTRYAPVS